MAATCSSNRGENDVVELEAMRKDTFSWHPCQVSLCSGAFGLLVQYGDNNLEEMISDKDGVLAQVRVRSTPLQGDDCSLLQQGDYVLATRNSKVKDLFYDAQVEEALRVRHSKRIHCRCSFKIKWLHQAIEEKASTVPASAVKKLSTKSIVLHPTISSFFSMLESSNGLETSPNLLSFDNMKLEVDISMLLEKQIEDINTSFDAPEKNISKNVAFGSKGDLKEQTHAISYDASLKNPRGTGLWLNNLRASMVTEINRSPERMMKDSRDIDPWNQGGFMGSGSPLSSLAARAALALLRSKFPLQSAEYSVHSNVEEGDITKSAVDFLSNTDDITLETSAATGGRSKKFESIVRTLFPASSSPPEVEFSNASSGAKANEVGKKRKNRENAAAQHSEKRVTRSQVQRIYRMQESSKTANVKETQLKPMETRFVQFHTPQNTKRPESSLSDTQKSIERPESSLSDTQKSIVSPIDVEHSIQSIEGDKNLLEKDGLIAKVGSHKKGYAKDSNGHDCSRRITRAAAREEMKKNVLSNLKHCENNAPESSKLDLSKGNVLPGHIKTTQNAGARMRSPYPKLETRSSPRLRSLPQTRSQNKF